jgi:hypothetical protein
LLDKGYNISAVGENYIDRPPASMASVAKNLVLIQDILNPNDDKHKVKDFMEVLKGKVYPRIDEFTKNAQVATYSFFSSSSSSSSSLSSSSFLLLLPLPSSSSTSSCSFVLPIILLPSFSLSSSFRSLTSLTLYSDGPL